MNQASSVTNTGWCKALTLSERRTTVTQTNHDPHRLAAAPPALQARFQRWRQQVPFAQDDYFVQRLQQEQLTEATFLQLLAEPATWPPAHQPPLPPWAKQITTAFAERTTTPTLTFNQTVAEQQIMRFLHVVEPLIRREVQRVRQAVERLTQQSAELPFDPATIVNLLFTRLPDTLQTMVCRTLTLELNVARLQGQLQGATPQERLFDFTQRLQQPEVALAILQEYPVLARQVHLTVEQWADFSIEFLTHLCHDYAELSPRFGNQKTLGKLVMAHGSGDQHGGKAVMVIEFDGGYRLVYKPHALAVDIHFQELLAWLNARGEHPAFRTLQVVDCGDHGWVEFVAAQGCTNVAALERFYERQGGYLALLYVLQATDFHHENLIAAGEDPVLIDLESLFHPYPATPAGAHSDAKASESMFYSVLRIGLLPQRVWVDGKYDGVEISGLGGQSGQMTPNELPYLDNLTSDELRIARKRMPLSTANNLPRLHDAEVNAIAYSESIVKGFRAIYRLLWQHRDELLAETGPLAQFRHDEVRVILRSTRTYSTLYQESFHPDLLRDALDRDQHFDYLWAEVTRQPHLMRVIPHERADLWRNNIPAFSTQPGSCDLWSTAGEQIPDFFTTSGEALVRARLAQLNQADLDRQIWFIRSSLTALAIDETHADWRRYQPRVTGNVYTAADRLAAACAIGDQLATLALHGEDDATWLGLSLIKQKYWALMPAQSDLYSGLPGIALFLGYLGEMSGQPQYKALAKAALTNLLRHVELAGADWPAIGGFSGWGGIIYTLTHLGKLWEEPELLQKVERIIDFLPALIAHDQSYDIIGGSAGCIGALLGFYACTGYQPALTVASQCGEWLLEHALTMPVGIGWPLDGGPPSTGFSHGNAGTAWALLALGHTGGDSRFTAAGLAALAYERSLFSPAHNNWPDLRHEDKPAADDQALATPYFCAWCHGAAGIGLGRLRILPYLDDATTRSEIEAAIQTTLEQGFGMNHCLCHGDFGNLELLLEAARQLDRPDLLAQTQTIADAVLASRDQEGWLCGVPLGVETPGLMNGLAGIGYGLLRLVAPERIPSVLTLEPPRP